jgi:putative phage-type endonuclease
MLTDKQRAERKLGIGGSDMPIIMGLSSYKTPYQLYLEKSEIVVSPDETSQYQYWGSILEGVIRDEFSKRNNVKVETPDTIVHPNYDFIRANIDGYIPEWNAVLEVKCASSFASKQWGDEGSDIIPMQYLVQVAHYCSVTNSDSAHIAVLIGGNDYREYKYVRDLDLEQYVINAAKTFWNCVQTKTPPAATNQVDLRLMFPTHKQDKKIKIAQDIADKLIALNETRFKIKALSDVEEKHKFNIMQFMQDAEVLVNENNEPVVSWKANKRGSRTFLVKGVTQ